MLDAPLGRTPSHGREGKLNIMGSGDKPAFDNVRPVLDDLGENVFHLGDLGTGHTIKLINNFFAQCVANGMAEAFAMKDRLVFMDIFIDPMEHVYPMHVAPNGSMKDMWLSKNERV